jgi:hypothetical protein
MTTPVPAIERIGNLGYYALSKESTPATAVIPATFLPGYKDTLETNLNLDELAPIVGVRAARYQTVMGVRSHEGILTLQAEPNTAEYIFDMLLTADVITGSTVYTHPFKAGLSNSYTLDILKGQIVHRYFGVMAQSVDINFNKNEMRFDVDVTARGSFFVREVASVSTTTITLKTDYDPAPNKGLVQGDLVRLMKADGSSNDFVIATAGVDADGITVRLTQTAAAYAAGDFFFIRAQTPTYTLLPPFKWSQTQFCFADTATNALAAAHTPLESGSKWKITNLFENKKGADRSGSFDPTNLVRTLHECSLTVKKFFDQPADLNNFLKVNGNACVVRHYMTSGGNAY